MVDAFLDWLTSLPTAGSYAVLMMLSAIENIIPPVPADVAVALGAFLERRAGRSPLLLGILCWAANTLSAAAMYALGRWKGREFFASGWPRALLPPSAMEAISSAYAKHGVFGIFVSRFLPGVRAAVTPFAGVAGMPVARALLPAALASGIWYAMIVFVASMLGLQWGVVRALLDRMNMALGLLGLVALAGFALWIVRRSRMR